MSEHESKIRSSFLPSLDRAADWWSATEISSPERMETANELPPSSFPPS